MPKTKVKAKTVSTKHKAVKKKSPSLSRVKQALMPQPETENFFELRFSEQSLYWIILGMLSVFFAMWTFSVDMKLQKLYDEVDATTYSLNQSMLTEHTR